MESNTPFRVFIASPGDLTVERKIFRNQTEVLNFGFGDGANIKFVPLGWEDTLATTGRRAQSVINREIDSCHIFILVLHRRWGQEAYDSEYSSYTEEEFYRAWNRFKKNGIPEIFVFFKKIDTASLADPGVQLQKVLEFKVLLEDTRQVLYKQFDTDEEFRNLVDQHLRAFVKGEVCPKDVDSFGILLSTAAKEEIGKAKGRLVEAEKRLESSKAADGVTTNANAAEELAIELSHTAAELAIDGKVEKARLKFAKATQASNSSEVLELAVKFYELIGESDESEILQ